MLELFKVGHVIFRETMAAISHYRERYEDIVENDNESQDNTEEENNSFESQMKGGVDTIRKWVHIFLPSAIEGFIHGLAHVIGCFGNKIREVTKTIADNTCEVFRKTVEESFVRFRDPQRSQENPAS